MKRETRNNPEKAKPKKKAQERAAAGAAARAPARRRGRGRRELILIAVCGVRARLHRADRRRARCARRGAAQGFHRGSAERDALRRARDRGRQAAFEIEAVRPAKDVLVARLKGVADRNAAEALTNLRLYVARAFCRSPMTMSSIMRIWSGLRR